MEVGLAMLRQLIGQVQELLELYGSPPPLSPDYFPRLQPHPPPSHHLCNHFCSSWRLLNLDGNSVKEKCYNFIMTTEKSGNLTMLGPCKFPASKRARKERIPRKLTENTNTVENMEQSVWKEFPEDLFEVLVARLPVTTFFRFRSVCKKWNSMLTSQSFRRQCADVPQAQPWFYTITRENVNGGAIYDPTLKKWLHPSVPALPTKLTILPVASAGGLVCFLDIGHTSFFVCNPLTRSSRELPARSVKVWSRIAVGMAPLKNSTGGGYGIVWVGSDGEYEVYNSLQNCWTRPGSIPTNMKLPLCLNFRSHSVSIDGRLYFMRSDPDGIVAYDMVAGTWKQFLIPAPLHLSDRSLAESEGRIMLVGLLTKNAATCVCIWELQKMTLLWKEVDRMPNIWCLDFYGKHIRMTCLGNKGLIMLSLRSRQMNRLVTYDLSSREWLKVPGCVLPNHGRRRQWIACGMSFDPCLTAVA